MLFCLASKAMQAFSPDVVVGWYLWPYATVAASLGRENKTPAFVVHAGSDLALLLRDSALREKFLPLLRELTGIATTRTAQPHLLKAVSGHIPRERIVTLSRYPLGNAFNNTSRPLSLHEYLALPLGLRAAAKIKTHR
jgi:hypothetical protein